MTAARRATLATTGGLALVGAAYVVAVALSGDDLPRGTRIAGTEVGGMSRAQAVAALGRQQASGTTAVTVDAEVSVDDAHAGRWSPVSLWHHVTGGGDHDAVVDVDERRLTAYVTRLTEKGTKPVDGAVRLTRNGVQVVAPEEGTGIDPDRARTELIRSAETGDAPELAEETLEPEIDRAEVDRARAEFAEPALSAPVTLSFQGTEVTLTPQQYARALVLEKQGGELVPTLRPKLLDAKLATLVAPDAQQPQDATVRLERGEPVVVEARPGVTYDDDQVDDAFLELVTRPEGERTLEVDAEVVEPAVSTADAAGWQIAEEVSTFTTYYPYADYRNVNLGRAAELVNGTVVPPGGTFSLNGTVGERTAENGFTEGFVISDGIFKEDLGGGVSQMATTTFNAAFFGGMTDVEHKPHSFYIDRYPVGREATVAWPTVDLRWKNDTPYGVLVQARVTPSTPSSQGVVTVSLWSTDYWDITTKTSERYAFTSPATRTLDTEDCYANTGYGGFDVNVWRYWRKAGSDVLERTERMHTTYTPSDTVICTPPGSLED